MVNAREVTPTAGQTHPGTDLDGQGRAQEHLDKKPRTMCRPDENEDNKLMPIVQEGLQQMLARKHHIDDQLAEMRTEGLRVIDIVRHDFTEKMDRIKEEFDNYQEVQRESWIEISEESKLTAEKLRQVSALVVQLNAATLVR